MECRLCNSGKQIVIKRRESIEVEVSEADKREYGIIQEQICNNIIQRKSNSKFSLSREICNNNMLKLERRGK